MAAVTKETKNPSDAEVLQRARLLVEAYFDYLEHTPLGSDVVDETELPGQRTALINCFRLLIATESRNDVRQKLREIGLTLAQFQSDIGERMSLMPVAHDLRSPEAEVQRLMALNRRSLAKIDEAYGAIMPERARLDQLFRHSMSIAEARFAGDKPPPHASHSGAHTGGGLH